MRREDQDKINRFSRLHQRELVLEDEIKIKSVSRVLDGFTEETVQAYKVATCRKREMSSMMLPWSSSWPKKMNLFGKLLDETTHICYQC